MFISNFDSSILSDHVSLDLEGYKLVQADHPNNVKWGDLRVYFKESLPGRLINLLYLQEAFLLVLNDQNKTKKLYQAVLALPVKTMKDLGTLENFEHLLSDIHVHKPPVSVILRWF